MRIAVGMGTAAALVMGPIVPAEVPGIPSVAVLRVAEDPPPSNKNINNSNTSGKDGGGSSGKAASSGNDGSSVNNTNNNQIPPALKNVTSLRVLPWNPRQNNNVRIFVHCPPCRTTRSSVPPRSTSRVRGGSTGRWDWDSPTGASDAAARASPISPCWDITRSA